MQSSGSSNIFGSLTSTPSESTAAPLSVFGGQVSSHSSVFGSQSTFGTQSVFGSSQSQSKPLMTSTSTTFGTSEGTATFGGASRFVGGTGTFGESSFGNSSTLQAQNTGLFGRQSTSSVFGESSKQSGGSGQAGNSASSFPASQPFSGPTFGTGIQTPPGSTQAPNQNPFLSQSTKKEVDSTQGSSFSMQSSSSSSSVLFGKPVGSSTFPSTGTAKLFPSARTSDVIDKSFQSGGTLFSKPVGGIKDTGQTRDPPVFTQSVFGENEHSEQRLFSKPLSRHLDGSGLGSQDNPLIIQDDPDAEWSHNKRETLQPKSLFDARPEPQSSSFPVTEQRHQGRGLFGKDQAFNPHQFSSNEKPVKTLFGKEQGPSLEEGSPIKEQRHQGKGLFGKDQASNPHQFSSNEQPARTLFGKEQGSSLEEGSPIKVQESPQRSVRKWSRARRPGQSGTPVKRNLFASQEQEDQVYSKRTRDEEEEKSSPPKQRARLSSLRQSVDDLTTRTSIMVKDIPARANKGSILRQHFSQFGQIKHVLPVPAKGYANITFHNHKAAAAAKMRGKHLVKGSPPVAIFWRSLSVQSAKSSSPKGREGASTEKSPTSRSAINDELASMSGTADYQDEFGTSSRPDTIHVMQTRTAQATRRSPTPPPAPAPTHSAPGSSDNIKGLLKSLINGRASDTTGRIALLDIKDKLCRLLRRQQQTDLASAKAFVGNCTDMCPEKERYYREDIRRLALYEVIPETLSSITGLKSEVDHYRAVKEYSRSSADQEEPLPYELRPLSTLMTTMTYLLTEVADRGEDGHWSEWYDFLWNRTRGIRKDITQQQLCDQQVAELLEKCSRFHILSSARLCEEDMMTFDTKINNENLTKCLQTLKELYSDLETKHGIYCPNEAEFRGYMVLMNLNEGDILREVQQLRPELRESSHIAFAVQVYNALNSSNYVRFFRLMERAPFLNACVCHRYFNQIRSKALRIIMKAHGALGKSKINYPVSDMVRLLRFEDEEEVEEFCFHYCLAVEKGEVILDARAYFEPESSLHLKRSQTLIEAKRAISVGQTINGGPLPPLQLPTPSSSFDQNGKFIITSDILNALAATGYKVPAFSASQPDMSVHPVTTTAQELTRPQPTQPALVFNRETLVTQNEAIKSTARTVILEVIDEVLPEVAEETLVEETEKESLLEDVLADIVESVVPGLVRSMSESVHEEEEAALRASIARDVQAQKERVTQGLALDIEEEGVTALASSVAQEEMIHVKEELHRQSVQRASASCSEDFLAEVCAELTRNVCQDVHQTDVVAKLARLEATERAVQRETCRRSFQVWQRRYQSHLRVKRAMLDFPSAPPTRSLGEQLHHLVPDQRDHGIHRKAFFVSDRARLHLESPMEVVRNQLQLTAHLSLASVRQMLAQLHTWSPLELVQILSPHLDDKVSEWKADGILEPEVSCIPWKLVVSVPSRKQLATEGESLFVDWMRAKLCTGDKRETKLEEVPDYKGEVLSNSWQAMPTTSSVVPLSLGVCVRCVHGGWTENQEISASKEGLMKGLTAVVFVSAEVERLLKDESAWLKEKQRLHQVLQQRAKKPAVPLVVVLPRASEAVALAPQDVLARLHLDSLYTRGLISAVHLAQPCIGSGRSLLESTEDWTSQLTNCVSFLAQHFPSPPCLRVKPVADFVEDAVVEFYKAPVYQDLRTRARRQLLHQSPNNLLTLYNEVIEHVAMTCASSTLTELSWPPPEVDSHSIKGIPPSWWNSEGHLCDVYGLVSRLRLPPFHYSDMEAEGWGAVCQDVWDFVQLIARKDSGAAKIGLFHKVQEVLLHSRHQFDQYCWQASEPGDCEPTYVNMAWTDLVDACIHYKLVSLRTAHLAIDKELDEDGEPQLLEFKETLVYYWQEELSDWEAPGSWLDALRDTETAEPGQLKPTVVEAASRLETTATLGDQTDQGPLVASTLASAAPEDGVQSAWETMRNKFEHERLEIASYEDMLEQALGTDTAPQRLSPFDSGALSAIPRKTILKQTPQRGKLLEHRDNETPLRRPLHPKEHNAGRTKTMEDLKNERVFTLSERVSDVKQQVSEERKADNLFEMNLQRLMTFDELPMDVELGNSM